MKHFFALFLLSLAIGAAQNYQDWKSVSVLKPGDKVRFSPKAGKPFTGRFQSWTPEGATVGALTLTQDKISKVERYKGGGHWKRTGIGALVGFGGGFALGAAAGGCHPHDFLCFGRGVSGVVVGVAGLVVGGVVGMLLPSHRKDLIYFKP